MCEVNKTLLGHGKPASHSPTALLTEPAPAGARDLTGAPAASPMPWGSSICSATGLEVGERGEELSCLRERCKVKSSSCFAARPALQCLGEHALRAAASLWKRFKAPSPVSR